MLCILPDDFQPKPFGARRNSREDVKAPRQKEFQTILKYIYSTLKLEEGDNIFDKLKIVETRSLCSNKNLRMFEGIWIFINRVCLRKETLRLHVIAPIWVVSCRHEGTWKACLLRSSEMVGGGHSFFVRGRVRQGKRIQLVGGHIDRVCDMQWIMVRVFFLYICLYILLNVYREIFM